MDDLKKAYEICKRKFRIHMEKMDATCLCELMPCPDGDYYSYPHGSDFYETGNWMTSFVTGMAPLFYQTEEDKEYLIWANSIAYMHLKDVDTYALSKAEGAEKWQLSVRSAMAQ